MSSFHGVRRLALPSLSILVLAGGLAAHEDDPKPLYTEPPFAGPGLRTHAGLGSAALAVASSPSFPKDRVELLSWVTLTSMGASAAMDCWGYTSPSGREYALIGLDTRTAFVEITDPRNPVIVKTESGPTCGWRDIEVFGSYAYVVSECGPGIQVFDLSAIDSGVVTKVNELGGASSASHTVALDPVSGFVYRNGGAANGLFAYDLNADPVNPPLVGTWATKYIHEMQVVTYASGPLAGKQIAFACSGFNGGWTSTGLTILDVTDKSNIQVMDEVFWSNAGYSHQAWLSPDRRYLYLNDELDEGSFGLTTTTHMIDVEDPFDAVWLGTFTNGKAATGHNLYVKGERIYESNYHTGLRVFDSSAALAPVEIASFDTYELDNNSGFNGMWGNYPFFPSGVVIASDRSKGLFVFWVEDPPLAWRWPDGEPAVLSTYGSSAVAEVVEKSAGELVPGSATLWYDAGSGYQSAPLASLGGNLFRVDFPSMPCGTTLSWYLSAESQNGISWLSPALGAARPMAMEAADNAYLAVYDDMEVGAGWTVSGVSAGQWELGDPVGAPETPEDDHTPNGTNCWFTDATNDVDGGTTTLTSPVYDLSGYANPVVSYWLWFSNNQGANPGTDPFKVQVTSNGTTWVTAVTTGPASVETQGDWLRYEFALADFVAPSATVRIRFQAEDNGSSALVEAAVDDLRIHDLGCGAVTYCASGTSASGCLAVLSAAGTPSASAASGFVLSASSVEGAKDGLFYFGTNGRQANAWGNGTSLQCVVPPVKRAALLAGSGTNGACDGSFAQDLNAYWCPTCPKAHKNPGAGAQVEAQLWYRDPLSTSNQATSLSHGIEFTLAP